MKEVSLDDWMAALRSRNRPREFEAYRFPSDRHLEEFVDRIDEWSDKDLRLVLLNFLPHSGSFGLDELHAKYLRGLQESNQELFRTLSEREFVRRLLVWERRKSAPPPWEGITWVLDLLPHYPSRALKALDAYFLANCQWLPDGRITGLGDATAIIRARYIGIPRTISAVLKTLLSEEPRVLECLTERLYHSLGYETRMTPQVRDGGCDVIATRTDPGRRELLLIECKRHERPVGIGFVRQLLGVLDDEKATKAVIVTVSRFTGPALRLAERNHRIELISGGEFVRLLNEHLGAKWTLRIDELARESERHALQSTQRASSSARVDHDSQVGG